MEPEGAEKPVLGPNDIAPSSPVLESSNDNPSKSSSTVWYLAGALDEIGSASRSEPFAPELDTVAGVISWGSGSKSISESSFAAFLPTPVVVPSVPFSILLAASISPAFINL